MSKELGPIHSRLELRARGNESLVYCGPGSLRQDEEGQLTYRIYASRPDNPQHLRRNNYGPAGTTIPEGAYFDLSAADIRGRTWLSKRVLPGSATWGPAEQPVVEGHVAELFCEGEIPSGTQVKGYSLDFIVFEKVKIPTNAPTSEHRHIAGLNSSHHFGSDAWRFRAVGLGFLLSNHRQDRLEIHVRSKDAEPPPHLGQRVLDALFFVLGRPLYPTITRYRTGHRTGCTLHSQRRVLVRARHKPPLGIAHFSHPKTGKSTAEPYRKLFERYLAYVLPDDKIHHPLWGQLNALYEASAGMFVDSQALTLAVAIESILSNEFPELGKPTTAERKRIDEVLEYCRKWDGDPKLKHRIDGTIRQLKQSRAGDKMKALAEQGAITAEAAEAWKPLRNASAHQYQRHSLNPEQFSDLVNTAQTLFYQLIFCAIGYRGFYRDYSMVDWPLRQYPPAKSEQKKASKA